MQSERDLRPHLTAGARVRYGMRAGFFHNLRNSITARLTVLSVSEYTGDFPGSLGLALQQSINA
jgi:hypothetical protein